MIALRVAGGSAAAERSGVVLPIRQNPDTLIHPRPIAMSRDKSSIAKGATNMERREVLKTMAIAGLAAGAGGATASAQTTAQTFVLVHGAWHGGWCWSRVADRLRTAGHQVFTPTQTGLGERKHLLSKDITLDTFTKDIANVIEAEELSSVILVGHSFGGLAISGTADAMPDRIRHLVYLDSLMVEGGKSPFDSLPPDVVAARRKAAEETSGGLSLPAPPPSAFGVSDAKDTDWVKRRLTPHPLGTYTSTLNIKARSATTCRAPISTARRRLMRRCRARATGSRRSRDGAGPKSPPATTPW